MNSHEEKLKALASGATLVAGTESLILHKGELLSTTDYVNWTRESQLDIDKWQLKPRTKKINGVEVPAPRTTKPECGSEYFTPAVETAAEYRDYVWRDSTSDNRRLQLGIVHDEPEHAVQHTKVFLSLTAERAA